MRTVHIAFLSVLIAAPGVSFACGGNSSPTSPSGTSNTSTSTGQQGLAGTWRATRAEFVSVTNSNLRVDIVAQGASLVLVLEASGNYTRTITDPGETPDTQTGAWSASRDVLTLRPSGVTFSIQFDYSQSGNSLSVSNGHVEFDFNGDDRFEEAILAATFVRQ